MFISDLPPFPLRHLAASRPGAVTRRPPTFEAPPNRLAFRSGRAAMLWGIKRLIAAGARRLLLPAFLCESVMAALKALDLPVAFYDIAADLGPSPSLDAIDRGDAVVAVHFFGLEVNLAPVVDACRRRGAFLVEDCAHCAPLALSGGCGGAGDVSFYSFRKQLPVPDGGLLLINRHTGLRLQESCGPLALCTASSKKMLLSAFEAFAFHLGINFFPIKTALRRRFGSTDNDFRSDPQRCERRVSACTCAVTAGYDWDGAAARRRENYRQLAERLQDVASVQVPLPDPPRHSIPQVLPVLAPLSEAAVERLQRLGIGASRWPGDQALRSLDYGRYPTSATWVAHGLLLPIHERISKGRLARVADAVARI